jgi:hypothetical protein
MNSNKIQVRLQNGNIGVPDKFIVGKDEYNNQSEAESAIKQQVIKDIDHWIECNTDLTDYWVIKDFTKSFYNINKEDLLELIELLTQLT